MRSRPIPVSLGDVNGRYLSILSTVAAIAGCNLFAPIQPGDNASDQGVADMAIADAVGGGDDGTPDSSDDTRSDGFDPSTDDVAIELDDGTVCVPASDAELCSALGANCGALAGETDASRIEIDVAANAVRPCETGATDGTVKFCSTNDGVAVDIEIPSDGAYRFELLARADLIGVIPALAELTIDGTVAGVVPVDQVPEPAEEYSLIVPLTAGTHSMTWMFANDAYQGAGIDRNLRILSIAVVGPLGTIVDNCGQIRTPQCGTCGAGETCGLLRPNECSCGCEDDSGDCVVESTDHPTMPCLRCGSLGWTGADFGCSDGDVCTTDTCYVPGGICRNDAVVCDGGSCRTGTCNSSGNCDFTPLADGTACGVAGECAEGECGCPDGTTLETQCMDSKDNDCDGLLNCEDPDCDGANCGAGNMCVMGVCQ